VSAFSDQLGIDWEEALRTADVPTLADPFPQPGTVEFDVFMLEAQQNSWKAAMAVLEPHLGGAGLWAPVGDPVVVGSTVTSFIAVDGESLDADGEWFLQLRLLLATGTVHQVRLGPRGSFADPSQNYDTGLVQRSTLLQQQAVLWLTSGAQGQAQFDADIWLSKRPGLGTSARFRAASLTTTGGGPRDVATITGALVDTETADLDRLDVGSTVSSRILSGSTAHLFKKAA
jgi:hypothetical protein